VVLAFISTGHPTTYRATMHRNKADLAVHRGAEPACVARRRRQPQDSIQLRAHNSAAGEHLQLEELRERSC